MIRIRLKELAEAKGLSMSDISFSARTTPVTIRAMWRNKITRREKLYNTLCTILDCTPGDLIEYIPDPPVTLDIQSVRQEQKAGNVSLASEAINKNP